jgi:hypothetical protein
LREPVDKLIKRSEFPHKIFVDGKVESKTVVVQGATPQKLTPLTREIYNQMTPQMQKMTLMDKVVVITG